MSTKHETPEDRLSRIKQMSVDRGDTWDLSRNDQFALAWAVEEIYRLRQQHAADCSENDALYEEVKRLRHNIRLLNEAENL
jgi:hypothetical protein